MRVATVDGLVTLFYDGSKELFNQEVHWEWVGECDDHDWNDADWEEWDLSDECKRYWRERQSWQQIIVAEGVTEIPEDTFMRCKSIRRVIFSSTVVRIKGWAFYACSSLSFIKLSINIEVIEMGAFRECNLISVFIPPRCREIKELAFSSNDNLSLFDVHSNVQLGNDLLSSTKLMKDSPFELDRWGNYYHEEEAHGWVKNINNDEKYSLHRACCSFQPPKEVLMAIIRRQGIGAFYFENKMGITPSRYLKENPFAAIKEMDIIQDYVMTMMGEKEE